MVFMVIIGERKNRIQLFHINKNTIEILNETVNAYYNIIYNTFGQTIYFRANTHAI